MLDSSIYDPNSPKRVKDIVGNTETWNDLASLIATNTAAHTVLAGPAGCGKSLFLRIVLADFPTLYIDCTANFGLRDVRDNIRVFGRGSRTYDGKIRWIIFEHADALTSDAQAFLRRMLETTSKTTRIIFECRDSGAISEPILSRSTIVAINAPEETEAVYEILRRTNFKLEKELAESIVQHSFGNMRAALLHAFAALYCAKNINIAAGMELIDKLLASRPSTLVPDDWIAWACKTECACRVEGLDLRVVLRRGWPTNPIVANTCQQWSRLGGTSPRALFFSCLAALCG